jgi:hypothetical protein
MKANINVNEDELEELMNRRRRIEIKFPKLEQKTFYLILGGILVFSIFLSFISHDSGFQSGIHNGYQNGFNDGEKVCIGKNMPNLSLSESLGYFVRYNMSGIAQWLGIVLGISWIIHGVGFRVA